MRELTYFIASTLDGFVADPSGGNPTDVSPGGFFLSQGDHSGPLLTAYPETVPGAVRELLGLDAENKVFDTVLMGRRTWELGRDTGAADPYPRLRSYVCSPKALWPEIDRLVVKVNPVVIGAGVKLFHSDEFALRKLRLDGHLVYESGVAVLTYSKE